MVSEFSAKQTNSHHKLIAFNKVVRAMVEGGQLILLMGKDQFAFLYSVYLLPDGVQGSGGGHFTHGEQ